MARDYKLLDVDEQLYEVRRNSIATSLLSLIAVVGIAVSPIGEYLHPVLLFILGLIPLFAFFGTSRTLSSTFWLEREREAESEKRGGKPVIGMPPRRDAFSEQLDKCRSKGKKMIDKYLVGFEVDTGEPIWIDEDDLCTHAAVFAKTGVGKTLWLESLIFQQMARGRASGCTFIDAKRDSGTLAHIIFMAMVTGRIEDLIVVDPFDTVHSYNFCLTQQRADVKARKVLRAGLPPTSDQSVTKHYDRLAADAIYRMVRALESFGLSWSIKDVAVALSAFNLSYPHLRKMLHKIGAKQALVELGHLAASYRNPKGTLDSARITDNLRGISSELHAIAGSESGQMFCTRYSDLVLTDAILRGKIIYFMLPRLEEAESANRMVKVFREDLEVSIGEITSSREHNLEDPHMVVIDEGSSTFGPTWANLFELARKGRFALLFGAQSAGGLTDNALGLSEAFYERVMANVNLKVTMRVGDNRTAADMAEWIGKVNTTKKTIGTGVTYSRMHQETKSFFDFSARRMGGESETLSLSEDEEDLVSPEELKHEMSAEKGLAWFDLGDGRVVKGRCFWFDADVPSTWMGREFIPRVERFEKDELGLADWVDEQILHTERKETLDKQPSRPAPTNNAPQQAQVAAKPAEEKKPEEEGNFRLSIMPGGRHRGRVTSFEAPQPKEETPEPPKEQKPKKEKKANKEESKVADLNAIKKGKEDFEKNKSKRGPGKLRLK
ncbi:MAG: TraM recognition domain-containing protein [Deltaproteobacteria bacterium]|nr:TraM recognition domain-containing protein [Deltaproteobacteria bacterium]